MSRLTFRTNGEEHDFWQNYTDLMAGFLVIFIIASVTAYTGYHKLIDYFEDGKLELTQDYKYFSYNEQYKRFECNLDIEFEPATSKFKSNVDPEALKAAGQELDEIVDHFKTQNELEYKVIIEGRVAKDYNKQKQKARECGETLLTNEKLSFERANKVYHFWKDNGFKQDDNSVWIVGSGFGGIGRYSGSAKEEEKNKRVIVQIIPYKKGTQKIEDNATNNIHN